MTYEWITPKTDWTYRDKFTYTDYNRIRNNMLYINEKINELFPELYMELDLGEPKTSYDEEYFPSEFNDFEDALISFERTGVNYNLGERYYHYDNDPFVWEDVLNRLETCLLRWKKVDKVAIQNIYLRPHGDEHTLMYIGDSALFDVVIEPSNATNKNSWTLDNDGDMYVSKYLTCEKISDTQVRVTYTKGRGENAYNNGSDDAQKMFMVEDKNSLTDTSGYNCSESIYTNYIRVKVERLKAKCPCHYLAQGSYINRKEDNGKNTRQYYKFKKIADNVDGRDITTLQLTLTDLYSPAVFGGNVWDANEIWRRAIEGISFWAFSKDLRDVMQSVRKEVRNNAISKTNYSSKFHLPSFYEYGSQNANVLDLGSPYPYLANNEIIYNGNSIGLVHNNYANCTQIATRSWYVEDKSLNSNGTPHGNGTQKGVLSSRNSYTETFNPPISTGIFPLIFIPSDLKVVAYMDCYKIDWSGESSLKLSDIPLGAIVFDADGNKGDYSPYVHAQSIILSKTSISMKETAVQTLDISSILPQDSTYGTYLNIYTDIPDCISLNYTTDGGMRKITVTGLKEGTGHIYVELDQFPNEPVIAVCNVNILYNHIAVDNIVINEPANPIDIWTKTSYTPETVQLSYTISPLNAKNKEVVWSSSNPNVATVDQTGKVTRIGHGTCVISVTAKDNNKSASRTVNVNYGVDSVSLRPNTWVNPNVNQTKELGVVVVPSYATGYSKSWASSNTSVVTVSNGVMTSKSSGNATVTLTVTEPHFNNNQLTATCDVSKIGVTGVQINEQTDPIVIWTKTAFTPETVQLTATVSPSDAGNKKVTWISSDDNVATVDGNGLVKRVGHGTCTITVKTEDGEKTDSREVEVNYGVTFITIKPQRWRGAKAGQTKQLNLIIEPSYASGYTITWSSQNTSKAIVSQTGLVTIVAVGDTLILATATEPHFNNNHVVGSMHILESVDMLCGMKIDFNKQDPYEAVTYIGDIADYAPASVKSDGDLDYGDWSQDEFFMPRPCMLKFDGTVDYYLDPDDYSKREDGITASDIANQNYFGSAMMEWGRDDRLIWIKATIDENDNNIIYVNITNEEIEGYEAYPFYKNSQEIVEHFYTSIYPAKITKLSGRFNSDNIEIRSIASTTLQNTENSLIKDGLSAMANIGEGWNYSTYADLIWIYFIACLLEKNISPQMFKRFLSSSANEGGLFKNKLFGMVYNNDYFYLLEGITCYTFGVYVKLIPPYEIFSSEPQGNLIYTTPTNGIEKNTNFVDVLNGIPCLPMYNGEAKTEIESSNKYQFSAQYANFKIRDGFDLKTKLYIDGGNGDKHNFRVSFRGTPIGIYVQSVSIPNSVTVRYPNTSARFTATYEPADAYAGDIYFVATGSSLSNTSAKIISKSGNRITFEVSPPRTNGTYSLYVYVGGRRSNTMSVIYRDN